MPKLYLGTEGIVVVDCNCYSLLGILLYSGQFIDDITPSLPSPLCELKKQIINLTGPLIHIYEK